jgi:thioredoxin reductase (NADPH)
MRSVVRRVEQPDASHLGFRAVSAATSLRRRPARRGRSARFLFANEATDIRIEGDGHVVVLADGTELSAQAVVIASGITYRRLGIPKLDELAGAGVYYGAVSTEARTLEGADVFVVGGGNSAGQAALHMAKYAHSVTLVVRKEGLEDTMSHYLTTPRGCPNVTLVPHSQIVDGEGQGRLEQLTIENLITGERRTVPAAGLFAMIGAQPHTEWLPEAILRDQEGFILTGSDLLEAGVAEGGGPLLRPAGHPPSRDEHAWGLAVGDVRHGSVTRRAGRARRGGALRHQYLADLDARGGVAASRIPDARPVAIATGRGGLAALTDAARLPPRSPRRPVSFARRASRHFGEPSVSPGRGS